MSVLVALASLRSLGRHPAQIALSVLGVALGVAVVVGIDLSAASARRAFELATESVTGRATHRIVALGGGGVPEGLYASLVLAGVPAGGALAPVVEGTVRVAGADREERTLRLFGVDPYAEAALRPWTAPAPGSARGTPGDAAELVATSDAALLADGTARALGLEPGARFRVRSGTRESEARLAGVLASADPVGARSLADLLVCDVATAQEWTQSLGELTRIDVALPADSMESAAAELAARLPPGVHLESARAQARGLQDMTRAFDLNLRALSWLALLVGVFLVYNTMTFSVVQRRELIATLRTLGATRGQVFRAILTEALWLALVGSACGLVLGTFLARGLVGFVAQTINDLYFAVSVSRVHLAPATLATGALLGIGATLLGALPPALEATRAAPRRAQGRSELEQRERERARPLALGALPLLGVAFLLMQLPGLAWSFAGLFLMLAAAALVAPAATLACSALAAGPFARAAGALGRHAARGVGRQLSRTSVAIAALAIALSATVGMGVLVASFRTTVARWLELSLAADVYVSATSDTGSRNTAVLPDGVLEAVRATDGVAGVSTYRGFDLSGPDGPVFAAASEVHPRGRAGFRFVGGAPADVWSAFEAGAVLVSESFAYRRGLAAGDALELPTDAGPRAFRIAGVYYDYASDQGFVMLARTTFERSWSLRGVSSIGVFAEEGADVEALVGRLREDLDEGLRIRSNRALRAATFEVFDRTFAVTEVLRLLAGLVAFVGVLSALMALQLERAREIGVLRAQGVTPRQVVGLVLAQTGLMGAIAGALALPLGLLLALVLILVINRRSFGWTLAITLPPGVLAGALVLGVGAALAAGLYPAWKMSRTRPARALRGD